MKVDVLRQPLMATLMLFAVLAILFVCRFLAYPYPEEAFTGAGTPVEAFLQGLAAKYRTASMIACTLLIFANGVSLSRILSQNMVLSSRSYLPMIFYLVVGCGIWFGGASLPTVLSSFLLIRGIEYFISSFVRRTSFNQVFRGALLVGCIPLIYPPATLYLLAIPAAAAVFRRSGRETAVAVIGGLFPLLTYAYVMWAMNLGFTAPIMEILDGSFAASGGMSLGIGSGLEIMRLIPAAIIGLLTVIGLGSFGITSGMMRTRARTIFVYFILLLLIGGGQLFITAAGPAALVLFAIPVATIIPVFFSRFTGWVPGAAYIALLLSITALNAYPLMIG